MPFKDSLSNNFCKCGEDHYPEWFKQYMKKFKKDLFRDLRSNISELVREEFEKEKKLADAKFFKLVPDKNESSTTTKIMRKKKISDKDIGALEKREMKLLKKFDKLNSYKFERLLYPLLNEEKLESRLSPLFEEARQLLETELQTNTKDAKKTFEPEKTYMKNGKFTLTTKSTAFLILQPGAEFSFKIKIVNNGRVPWVSPHMECMSTPDVSIKEKIITLPGLEPGQSASVTIEGKVTQNLGHYYFTYKLFDDSEEFGPMFSCFIVVSDSKKKIILNSEQLKLNNKATPTENFVGTLIDSENVTIADSHKKIKENIIEIERTLQDIDVLKPYVSRDKIKEESLNHNPGEFQIKGCDPIKDKERKFWKEGLKEELTCTVDSFEQMGKTEKSENVENEKFQTKKNEAESDSDSELSVILMSEEDENFIFVSLLPENSNSETQYNTTKSSKFDLRKESKEADQKPKKDIVEERSEKVQPKEVGCKGISAGDNCLCYRSEIERRERTNPSFDSIPTSIHVKPLNVVSNGHYKRNVPPRMFGKTNFPPRYTALNVESNGSPIGYSPEEMSLSKTMKTEEKRSHHQSAPSYFFYNTRECCRLKGVKTHNIGSENHWPNFVPTYDCLGKPIYAVRYDGYCFPMKDLIQNKERVPDVVGMVDSKEETQKELNAQMYINHITNEDATKTTTQNGMISVASKAFETAKYVINNLQSAFKQEVENKSYDTEKLKPHEEPVNNFPYDLYSMGEIERRYVEKLTNKEEYIDAMLTLHEMGFVNSDLNFRLLKKHDCQLLNVITEILDMAAEETVG